MGQTGSDTLTTDGHIYSTVTYQYSEQTSDNSTVSESDAAAGWSRVGSASDSYSTTDSGTITVNDTVTTSFDSFSVQDNHSIGGSLASSTSDATHTVSYGDVGSVLAEAIASGTKSSSAGDSFSFTDTESSTDNFVLNKTVVGTENANATDSTTQTMSETGTTAAGAYGYNVFSQTFNNVNSSGNITDIGVTPFCPVDAAVADGRPDVHRRPASRRRHGGIRIHDVNHRQLGRYLRDHHFQQMSCLLADATRRASECHGLRE